MTCRFKTSIAALSGSKTSDLPRRRPRQASEEFRDEYATRPNVVTGRGHAVGAFADGLIKHLVHKR